jgi:hypothetical protein
VLFDIYNNYLSIYIYIYIYIYDETVKLVLAIWKTMNQSQFYFILLYPFDLGLLGCGEKRLKKRVGLQLRERKREG